MYTVYILYSAPFDKIYIGFSQNLEQRLLSHNELGKKGWTIKFRPWQLIYKEEFETIQEAKRRELYIKKQKSRIYIERLIAQR